jgi:DHA1 family multidrug resistance protein-like MFS transporter
MRGLYITAAVTMAGVSSVFALLAELESRYGLSTSGLGLIAGSSFLAALVAQLWLSRYADRGYAATLLRAGVVASGVGLLWFGLATELWQFVAARSVLGAGVGLLVPPARRAIVLTATNDQAERLGTFYAAYLAGFVFGPPIGSVLNDIGDVRLPFLVFGTLTILSVGSIWRIDMPEADRDAEISTTDRKVLRRLLVDRRVIAAMLVVVSFRYSIGVFEPLWATHLDDLGASTRLIAFSLTGFALPMLIIAKPAGRATDRFGARKMSLLAALAGAPLMMTYGYMPWVWVIIGVAGIHGVSEAVLSPASQATIADVTADDDSAAAQGLAEAAGSAASAVGAFSAPVAFDAWGAGPAWVMAGFVMTGLVSTSYLLDPVRWNTRRDMTKGKLGARGMGRHTQASDAIVDSSVGSRDS